MVNETHSILRLLIESKGEYSIRKISKIRKINYKSAYNAIKKIDHLLSIRPAGNTSLCSFNHSFSPLVFEVEYRRTQSIKKDKKVNIIHRRLSSITSPFCALLFGSYAKKTADKHSDIDLLIISNNEDILHDISIPKTHITHVTSEEFISMINSSEFSVVLEATTQYYILIGIEYYYRLWENALERQGKTSKK